jgi:hypothetical protein
MLDVGALADDLDEVPLADGLGDVLHGRVEGVAETTASMLRLFSGWISDRFRKRKSLVVFGYTPSSYSG